LYKSEYISVIKNAFRGNNRSRTSKYFEVEPTFGDLFYKQKPLGFTISDLIESYQPAGGNQELKKSGKMFSTRSDSGMITDWAIRYRAFDEGKRSNHSYNYAALQHNNLVFQHLRGKSAEFLYRPFEEKKKELYKRLRKRMGRVIK
jgi:hypothetical protein